MVECDCYTELLEEIKKIHKDDTAQWESYNLVMGKKITVMPYMTFSIIKKKKDGTPLTRKVKNHYGDVVGEGKVRKTVTFLCSYCPFCGKKLKYEKG